MGDKAERKAVSDAIIKHLDGLSLQELVIVLRRIFALEDLRLSE